MAGSPRQASPYRRGITASVLAAFQIALLSAGLVVPITIVSASISANAGNQAASEDHEEGASVCGHKRSRGRSFVITQPPVAVSRDTNAPRIGRESSSARRGVRAPDGHRHANGLLAPLRC